MMIGVCPMHHVCHLEQSDWKC